MSQHARIEEVSSSEEEEDSDPSEMDPSEFTNTIIRPSNIPTSTSSLPPPQQQQRQQQLSPQFRAPSSTDTEAHKRWQCLFPIYFDANRTRAEGRRVGKALAVENPLAREIVDAVQGLGLNVVFEPAKTHPRDWSNPGRVRILIKEDGMVKNSRVKNKHHLYTLVSAHLKSHPTTTSSPLRLRIQGMPLPDKPIPAPAVPRGWKMNKILPLHSPALSGGGVSENIIKDMMQEMQGGMPGGMGQVEGSSGGGGGGGKKEKKKGKKG